MIVGEGILRIARRGTSEGDREGAKDDRRSPEYSPDLREEKFRVSGSQQDLHDASTGFPQRTESRCRCRISRVECPTCDVGHEYNASQFPMNRLLRAASCLLLALAIPHIAAGADAALFRIHLTDGTSIVSFGEYARINDQVVFSMPVGGSSDAPQLQVVSLAAANVDWEQTETDAAATRYQQYVATRAEDDYQVLNSEVARVLNDIALSTDRQQALTMAEQARRTLAAWPRAHYGYRQDDVREIVGLIDEAIARLRGTPAQSAGFELALVAGPQFTSNTPIVVPTPRESVDALVRLARLSTRVPERVALLQSALTALGNPSNSYSTIEAMALRKSIEDQIHEEKVIDDRYTRLSARLVGVASRAAARASVDDVQRVLDRIAREDVRLGARRPEAIQALRTAVEAELDAARRLRLLRDQWTIRRSLYREYQNTVQSQVLQLVKAQPALEAIRRLEGPPPDRLMALRGQLAGGAERLERMKVIDDLRPMHDLIVNAWRFAQHAADTRYNAVTTGNVSTAWEASSAAAGALMMLGRAQDGIHTLLEPPHLP